MGSEGWGISARRESNFREGGQCEPERVGGTSGARDVESPKFGVQVRDGGVARDFLEQLAEDVSRERDERNPRNACHGGHDSQRRTDAVKRTWLRADDGRRLGLHDEAPKREFEAGIVTWADAAKTTNFPGIKGSE